MTTTLKPTKNSKSKDAIKNFDSTIIADGLRTVNSSSDSQPTYVVKSVYEIPTLPLTAKAVLFIGFTIKLKAFKGLIVISFNQSREVSIEHLQRM